MLYVGPWERLIQIARVVYYAYSITLAAESLIISVFCNRLFIYISSFELTMGGGL